MNKNLIDFTTKLVYKNKTKLKNLRLKDYDVEDAIQNSLLQVIEENITEIEGNELRINHIVVYNINLLNNRNAKDYKLIIRGIEIENEEYEDVVCNTNLIHQHFQNFLHCNTINSNHLSIFEKIKFEGLKYKEVGEDDYNRKIVSRIMQKFKTYLKNKKIKLSDFYNEEVE